ncbi:MAG TPA: hypothetical protein VH044_12270 [Polyangiaceae bacterium]|jgi:hypothetical protein|nr:hypothetical protein [Polyangiaceae bacterium]
MKKMTIITGIATLAATLSALAADAPASTLASWGPNPPGSYASITVHGTGSDFVTYTPIVTTAYAEDRIDSFFGLFTDEVHVSCSNGTNNAITGTNLSGNLAVACPFFASTVQMGGGSVTSF